MKKSDVPNPCPRCGRYKTRAVTVDAVVVDNDNVLLIKRGNEPFKDCWALPGGYMDFDETAGEACYRELAEETGLKAEGLYFIGEFSQPGRHPEQCIALAFLIMEWDGRLAAGDDAQEAKWFPMTDLPADIAFDHKKIVECAAAQREGLL
ncbi:MAG: NUDIX hydrolase [Spirochaetales bacterium]|nr:NUDIX hydrolase [Spirochaetales bacterium]